MSSLAYKNPEDSYLDFWSEYAKKPIDWINMNPRDRSDFRERVRRETLRGKIAVFHENIETYLIRQARSYTTFRTFLHWYLTYQITRHCLTSFLVTFADKAHYGKWRNHPNYIKLGPTWSWLYYLRCWAMLWIFSRVSLLFYRRIKDHWNGKEDKVSSLLNDWSYDDFHRDAEDMRYVNFRYTDHQDREPTMSYWSNQMYKPEADKYKQLYNHFRYGTDTIFQSFFKKFI